MKASNRANPSLRVRVRWLLALCAVAGLAGCSNEAAEREAAQAAAARAEASASALQANIDRSIADGRPDLARAFAEDLVTRHPDTAAGRAVLPQLPELRAAAEAADEARRLRDLWTYHAVDDAEAGGTVYTAFIYAQEGSPGMPPLRLVLRRHPSWGQSAYLLINDADFACQATCRMQLVADDGEPQAMEISRAEGNVPPSVFIDADAQFIERLQAAKVIELRLALAPSRDAGFRFEVGGFDPERLGPALTSELPPGAKRPSG